MATQSQWWHNVDIDDPISLEPISELPYEPFSIMSGSVRQYFDPKLLAQFMCQSSCFNNPLSGVPFTRMDCRRLDAHLRNSDPPCDEYRVVELFDVYQKQRNVPGSQRAQASSDPTQQRQAALAMLNLFDFSAGRSRASMAHRNGADGSDSRWSDQMVAHASALTAKLDDHADFPTIQTASEISTTAAQLGITHAQAKQLAAPARASSSDTRGPSVWNGARRSASSSSSSAGGSAWASLLRDQSKTAFTKSRYVRQKEARQQEARMVAQLNKYASLEILKPLGGNGEAGCGDAGSKSTAAVSASASALANPYAPLFFPYSRYCFELVTGDAKKNGWIFETAQTLAEVAKAGAGSGEGRHFNCDFSLPAWKRALVHELAAHHGVDSGTIGNAKCELLRVLAGPNARIPHVSPFSVLQSPALHKALSAKVSDKNSLSNSVHDAGRKRSQLQGVYIWGLGRLVGGGLRDSTLKKDREFIRNAIRELTGIAVNIPSITPLGDVKLFGEFLVNPGDARGCKTLLTRLNECQTNGRSKVPFFYQAWTADKRWTDDQMRLTQSPEFVADVKRRRGLLDLPSSSEDRPTDAWDE